MNYNIDWSASDNSEDETIPTTSKRCNYCSIILKSATDVLEHETYECKTAKNCSASRVNCKNGISKFVCDICYKTFKALKSLTEHFQRHEPPGGFICKYCNERYCTAVQLDKHTEDTHKVYSCQICKEIFETTDSYVNHIQNIHFGQQKEYKSCENCGRQFYDLKILKFHLETNCGADKKFKCVDCGKGFINKYILKAHMDIHTGKREFFCSYCGDGFLKKGSLQIHERKHTGEKPYKCSVCSKTFAHRQSLVTHSSLHTGIKPYYCECCKSQFSCTGNLIAHRKKRPDTCGQPQFCTKLSKICPRPSIYNPQHLTSVEPIKIAKSRKVLKSNEQKQNEKEKEHGKIKKTNRKSESEINNKSTEKKIIIRNNHNKELKSIQCSGTRKSSRIIKKNRININHEHQFLDIKSEIEQTEYEELTIKGRIQEFEFDNEWSPSISIKDELNVFTTNIKRKDSSDDEYLSEIKNKLKTRTKCSIKSLDKNIKCKECKDKSFVKLSAFEIHLRKHHQKSENEVKKALEETKGCYPLSCSICNKSYDSTLALKKHIKAHGPEGNLIHRCRICCKYFSSLQDVKIHMETVHKDRLTCQYCNKIFQSSHYVSKHIRFKHKGEKKLTKPEIKKYSYICNKCGRVLSSKSLLNNHESSDCGKNPIHVCNICGKGLTTAGILKSHMSLHTGELLHSCSFCGKRFRNKYQRTEHERVHTGEQPFQCTYCEQRFSHRTNLFIHLSTHTGVKRYRCTGCGDRFSCISGLKAHWRTYSSTCGKDPNKTTKPIGEYIGFRKGKIVHKKEAFTGEHKL